MRAFLVQHGTTLGQARSDLLLEEIVSMSGTIEAIRVDCAFPPLPGRLNRQPFIDVVEAWAIRRAVVRAEQDFGRPDLYVMPTTTAALLQPRRVLIRSAVRFDALACENRRMPGGFLSRFLEWCYMRHVWLLLPYSRMPLTRFPRHRFYRGREVIPFPTAVDVSGALSEAHHTKSVLAYCANPEKKGLDLVIETWREASLTDCELHIVGISERDFQEFLRLRGVHRPRNVILEGKVSHTDFVSMLARSRVYLASARYEDFGIAPLEAMAAGAIVVSGQSRGPFEASWLLRQYAPEMLQPLGDIVSLARALQHAMSLTSDEVDRRARAGRRAVAAYSVDAVVLSALETVLPALVRLGGQRSR